MNQKALKYAISFIPALAASASIATAHHFEQNFLFFLIPQSFIVTLLFLLPQRPTISHASSIALALHLLIFNYWLAHNPTDDDALVWAVGYLFALPGSIVGALISSLMLHENKVNSPAKIFMLCFSLTAVGLIINQIVIFKT